jgi:hypothetical protein
MNRPHNEFVIFDLSLAFRFFDLSLVFRFRAKICASPSGWGGAGASPRCWLVKPKFRNLESCSSSVHWDSVTAKRPISCN